MDYKEKNGGTWLGLHLPDDIQRLVSQLADKKGVYQQDIIIDILREGFRIGGKK